MIETLKGDHGHVWEKPVPGFNCVFFVILENFCNTLDYLRLLLLYTFSPDLWRMYTLGRNLVQCSRIHFTFTKVMNTLISTKNRIYIFLVGPSVSGKTYLVHEWLKFGTFQTKFDNIYFSINTRNHSMMSCRKNLIILSLLKVYTLSLSTL